MYHHEDEEILPALRNEIAIERDKMSLLPSFSNKLAALLRDRDFSVDRVLVPIENALRVKQGLERPPID